MTRNLEIKIPIPTISCRAPGKKTYQCLSLKDVAPDYYDFINTIILNDEEDNPVEISGKEFKKRLIDLVLLKCNFISDDDIIEYDGESIFHVCENGSYEQEMEEYQKKLTIYNNAIKELKASKQKLIEKTINNIENCIDSLKEK